MNWFLKVLKHYADFNGRARRREYWLFSLFNMIFMLSVIFLNNILLVTIGNCYSEFYNYFGYLNVAYLIAVLIPGLAVVVRRLHDVGKSGWMVLIALIPIIGAIWLLVLLLKDSKPEVNIYGTDPKELERNDEKDGVKNASVFLMIASAYWIFLIVFNGTSIISTPQRLEHFLVNILDYYINQSYIIIPVALLFFAISIIEKQSKNCINK